MNFDSMVTAGMAVFKKKLKELCREEIEKPLSPEMAHTLTSGITQAAAAASRAVFKALLESKDVRCAQVVAGEETFHFKCLSEKRYLRNAGFANEPFCMLWLSQPQHTKSCVAIG